LIDEEGFEGRPAWFEGLIEDDEGFVGDIAFEMWGFEDETGGMGEEQELAKLEKSPNIDEILSPQNELHRARDRDSIVTTQKQ